MNELEQARAARDLERAQDEAKAMLWPAMVKTLRQCEEEMCRQTYPGTRRKDLNWVIGKARVLLAKCKELGIDHV